MCMGALEKYGLKAEDWMYAGQWKQPPLSAHFWVHGYDKELCASIGLEPFDDRVIDVNGHTIIHKKGLEDLKRNLLKAIENKDDNFVKRFAEVSLEVLEAHKKLVPELEASKGADIELFKRFIASARKVMVPWYVGFVFSDYMGEILVEKAEEHGIPGTKIVEYIPQKESLMTLQHKGALNIKKLLEEKGLLGGPVEKVKEDTEAWVKIQSHVDEYEWYGTHHVWGDPLTAEKLLKEVVSMEEPAIAGEKNPELPEDLKFAIKAAGEISFFRQYPVEIFNLVAFKARPLLRAIGEKLGLNYEELTLLTADEIIKYMESGTKPAKDKLMGRKEHFGVFLKDGREIIIDDPKEVAEFEEKLVPQKDTSVNEFKGMVACKGHAKGTVKVFLVPEELSKMKEGDVLVTTMTTPDFVPLMHKASAIVTDIGGLLSHAAIISREMGKPCVIGTEIATQVLKDGDQVEVDAEKGIVRKL